MPLNAHDGQAQVQVRLKIQHQITAVIQEVNNLCKNKPYKNRCIYCYRFQVFLLEFINIYKLCM